MRKTTKHYPIIYARYLFPLFSNILLSVILFLPTVRFSYNGDARQKMSVFELMGNVWKNSRTYLFSSDIQKSNDLVLFYKLIFAVLIISSLFILICFLFNIFSTVVWARFFFSNDARIRDIYTSFVPNRFVFLCFQLLILPCAFFADVFKSLSRNILIQDVDLVYTPLSTGIIALVLIALTAILCVASLKKENEKELNIFSYRKANANKKGVSSTEDRHTEARRVYDRNTSNKDGNAEDIKRLLGYSDDDKNGL